MPAARREIRVVA